MNVLYIWDADYPWDIRVEKICCSLQKKGNTVHIAARNLRKMAECELINGIYIHRLKPWKNSRINYALSFPAFFSPVWNNFLNDIVIKSQIDVIIVRDLPMAIAGIWCGKRNKIPVIFDMAEDYVSMIWDIWKARKFQGFNLVVRNPYLAKIVEKYVFKNSDRILIVVEEARKVILSNGGKAEKITIVSNTPSLELFADGDNGGSEQHMPPTIRDHFGAIYIGGIQLGRGIQIVIDAIPEIINNIPNFLFVILGSGYAKQQLQELSFKKGVDRYIKWIGWVDHRDIFSYIKACKIGIIPHYTSDHVNTTIPNKIFDYMGSGLPILASDAIPMKRILEEEICGKTFKSGDAHDFAATLVTMHNDGYAYGLNGKKAVFSKYNWNEDEKRLLNVIDDLKTNRTVG